MDHMITEEQISGFSNYLASAEKSEGTIDNYVRHIRRFAHYLHDREVNKSSVRQWKDALIRQNYQTATINAMLVSLNSFLKWYGKPECCVKTLRMQKRLFREEYKELTQAEYAKLIHAAREAKKERTALLIETICATGIRVGEVRYITVDAVRLGYAEIRLKGKIRRILLPGKLRRKLRQYSKKEKIVSGEIFITRNGRSLNRRQIWAELKRLCPGADVLPTKVFPHNLRHLFAVTFYKVNKDISRLADILGHSRVETTRIYLLTNSADHLRQMDCLGLVL